MTKIPVDLGLTALDELFMTDEGRKESKLPRIQDIPLNEIDDMPNHPFKVRRDDEDMIELIESVKNYPCTSLRAQLQLRSGGGQAILQRKQQNESRGGFRNG